MRLTIKNENSFLGPLQKDLLMSNASSRAPKTSWVRVVIAAAGAAVAVAVILLAFIWPTLTSSVQNLPLAITGSAAQVKSVKTALHEKAPGTFTLTTVSTRAEAVKEIKRRDVYGAIVLTTRPEVLTASANGTAVVQILDGVATEIQAKANAAAQAGVAAAIAAHHAPAGTRAPTITVKVVDMVPLASKDSRGLGLSVAAFPLVLGGMLGGILIALLVTGSWRRVTAVAIYSILGGVAAAAVMQGMFGVLQGDFILTATALTMAMAGTASFVVGMNALIGNPGIAVGSVITTLIGNPLSAATQPLQFLVPPWGEIGQWFVPGATTTLVRDLSYFPDANPTFVWLVLAGWVVVGLIATIGGHFRNRQDVRIDHSVEGEGPHHPAHLDHPAHSAA